MQFSARGCGLCRSRPPVTERAPTDSRNLFSGSRRSASHQISRVAQSQFSGIRSMQPTLRSRIFQAKLRPPSHWQFISVLEQEPSPDSRVILGQTRDALNMRQVRLNWSIGELTKKTLRRTREIISTDIRNAGYACWMRNAEDDNAPRWVWHHMGTTRMSDDPNHSVVDADCRVHGMSKSLCGRKFGLPNSWKRHADPDGRRARASSCRSHQV